jgi:hypothetical protein
MNEYGMLYVSMCEYLWLFSDDVVVMCVCVLVVSDICELLKEVQWNSLKKNLVKKISHLRSQDKKAPEFSHFIKIALLRTFPLKKWDFLGILKIFLTGFHCMSLTLTLLKHIFLKFALIHAELIAL